MAAAGILYGHLVRSVLDDKAAAIGKGMAKLDKFAAIAQANILPGVIGSEAKLPIAGRNTIQRGQRRRISCGRRNDTGGVSYEESRHDEQSDREWLHFQNF